MNVPRIAGLVAGLVLMATLVPAPPATAHFCVRVERVAESPPPPPACSSTNCKDGQYHEHHLIDLPLGWDGCYSGAHLCGPQATHVYVAGGDVGWRSGTADSARSLHGVAVRDADGRDCDGDGVPGDFDGDYETGVGGAFFGSGHWADEPICGYGLHRHGPMVSVWDLRFENRTKFRVGVNDVDGPIVVTDPVSGQTLACMADGLLSPDSDPDDCLSPTYMGTGMAPCGGGGADGGYWVFIAVGPRESDFQVDFDRATGGLVTAF